MYKVLGVYKEVEEKPPKMFISRKNFSVNLLRKNNNLESFSFLNLNYPKFPNFFFYIKRYFKDINSLNKLKLNIIKQLFNLFDKFNI